MRGIERFRSTDSGDLHEVHHRCRHPRGDACPRHRPAKPPKPFAASTPTSTFEPDPAHARPFRRSGQERNSRRTTSCRAMARRSAASISCCRSTGRTIDEQSPGQDAAAVGGRQWRRGARSPRRSACSTASRNSEREILWSLKNVDGDWKVVGHRIEDERLERADCDSLELQRSGDCAIDKRECTRQLGSKEAIDERPHWCPCPGVPALAGALRLPERRQRPCGPSMRIPDSSWRPSARDRFVDPALSRSSTRTTPSRRPARKGASTRRSPFDDTDYDLAEVDGDAQLLRSRDRRQEAKVVATFKVRECAAPDAMEAAQGRRRLEDRRPRVDDRDWALSQFNCE